jgi:hypothetical protein
VLQELQNDNAELLQRLRVFTFGNPSHDWDFELGQAKHFHNEKDFVAKLGVGRKGAAQAYGGTIFANSSWKGQLFNAQYSFNPKHYGIARGASKLLACTDGSNPQTMAVRKRKPKAKPEAEADESPERKPKPPPKAKAEPEYGSESESEEEPETEPEKNPKPKPKPRVSPQATLPEGRNKRVHLKQALPRRLSIDSTWIKTLPVECPSTLIFVISFTLTKRVSLSPGTYYLHKDCLSILFYHCH